MKDAALSNKNEFINFMGKMEQIGHILINQEIVKKDIRQSLSVPETFKGFMSGHNLI